jgi:4'-phosphopantetheinyl transferase EntD
VSPLGAAVAGLASRTGVALALVAVDGAGRGAQRAAGAHAAETALAAAGCSAGCTVAGHAGDGRPLWPRGFTGSIAHTDRDAVAAAVAVDAGAETVAIGVDIEESAALAAVDAALVLATEERDALRDHPRPDWLATLLWSAKESAFKAWCTATGGGLGTVDPVDIHVAVDEHACTFTVTATAGLGEIVRACGDVRGAYVDADGRVVTLVVPATASG